MNIFETTQMQVSSPGRARLDALTGIRFFAAFAVLLYHYGAAFSERAHAPAWVSNILHNGYMGVSLFFVLSGFILTHSYDERLNDWADLRRFMVARLARVYPVYLLALLVALPVLGEALTPTQMLEVLSLTQAWREPSSSNGYLWIMQAWSLSVEIFFYLMFPVLFALVRRLSLIGTLTVLVIAAGALLCWGSSSIAPGTPTVPNLPQSWTPMLPLLRAVEFVFGVALCRYWRLAPWSLTRLSQGYATLVVLVAILVWLAAFSDRHIVAWVTVLFGVLILQLSAGSNAITRTLSTPKLVLLGGASFSLYILQGPVRAWLKMLVPAPYDAALNPLVAISVSILVFQYYEEPMRTVVQSMATKLFNFRAKVARPR